MLGDFEHRVDGETVCLIGQRPVGRTTTSTAWAAIAAAICETLTADTAGGSARSPSAIVRSVRQFLTDRRRCFRATACTTGEVPPLDPQNLVSALQILVAFPQRLIDIFGWGALHVDLVPLDVRSISTPIERARPPLDHCRERRAAVLLICSRLRLGSRLDGCLHLLCTSDEMLADRAQRVHALRIGVQRQPRPGLTK